MTVQHVALGVAADVRAAGGKLFLPGAAEFASTLKLGQILKGKVMRHFEGGRYLVSFDGRERVVDSSVPLTTGELIHGRVIGLGERVEMQRVYPAEEAARPSAPLAAAGAQELAQAGRHERLVDGVAAQFRAELNASDRSTLMRAARLASDPNAMALVGVMVHKLGLRQSPDLLWPVYRALVRENSPSAALYAGSEAAPLVAVAGGDATLQANAVRQLADMLQKQLELRADRKESRPAALPGRAAAPAHDGVAPAAVNAVRSPLDPDAEGADPRALAQRLLNAQTGGSVGHRLGTVPLLLDGRLVEVDLSFFEQHKGRGDETGTRHRKVMFALNLERLGYVEVTASLSSRHVRLHVATSDEAATATVAAHVDALRGALAEGGWEIDEIVYETRQADSQNRVVRSVVDHVVSQDSLNRLV